MYYLQGTEAIRKGNQPFIPHASVHSTRKKGATLAFLANVPIADISMAATWASPRKHYCVGGDLNKEAQVGQKVLLKAKRRVEGE